jgi:hypothetical protein
MSGNEFQAAVGIELVKELGHPVQRECEPNLWHDPAPARVLRAVAEWRRDQGG